MAQFDRAGREYLQHFQFAPDSQHHRQHRRLASITNPGASCTGEELQLGGQQHVPFECHFRSAHRGRLSHR